MEFIIVVVRSILNLCLSLWPREKDLSELQHLPIRPNIQINNFQIANFFLEEKGASLKEEVKR